MVKETYQVEMVFGNIEVVVIKGIIKEISHPLKMWKGSKWERFYDYYYRRDKIIKVVKKDKK